MALVVIVSFIFGLACHVILTQWIIPVPKCRAKQCMGDNVLRCWRFFVVKFIHTLLLEACCFILINSIQDFFILEKKGFIAFSVLGILLFVVLFVGLPLHYFIMRKKTTNLKQTIFGTYYDGLKQTNFLWVTYYAVFLLRWVLHACIIFATMNANPIIGIVCFDVF